MKNKIKVFRAMRGLRQEDLANEVSVSRQTIVAIETGKYDPSLDLAFKIALFLMSRLKTFSPTKSEGGKICLKRQVPRPGARTGSFPGSIFLFSHA